MSKLNTNTKLTKSQKLKLEELMKSISPTEKNKKDVDINLPLQPISTNKGWFALQIDRDFQTGLYGEGLRLYFTEKTDKYYIIKNAKFEDNVLTIFTKCGKAWNLLKEPDNKTFENTIYSDWKRYDELYLKGEEDRSDYEPWALDSIYALAIELKELKMDDVIMYYKKIHLS